MYEIFDMRTCGLSYQIKGPTTVKLAKTGFNCKIVKFRGCSQMTSALFGVSDTPWCLCQPIISFWPAPWCFKLTTSALNQKRSSLDDHWKCPINHPFAPKRVQLSLVRPTRAFFGWIPSNPWIFHHSSSFLMTLGPSSSAFVSFLSYHWLFNVATSFVNGPLFK